MFFAFAVNCLVCLQIMQNAVVTINAVTGVNIYASSFVLPLGVAAYAIIGGLKVSKVVSRLIRVLLSHGFKFGLSGFRVLSVGCHTFCPPELIWHSLLAVKFRFLTSLQATFTTSYLHTIFIYIVGGFAQDDFNSFLPPHT